MCKLISVRKEFHIPHFTVSCNVSNYFFMFPQRLVGSNAICMLWKFGLVTYFQIMLTGSFDLFVICPGLHFLAY